MSNPPEEPYFVDFMRDPPEATGEEADDDELDDPKIYEQVFKQNNYSYIFDSV